MKSLSHSMPCMCTLFNNKYYKVNIKQKIFMSITDHYDSCISNYFEHVGFAFGNKLPLK